MAVWVRAEDLVVAFVGPFASRAEAEAHVEFCKARGDGAVFEIRERIEEGPTADDWTLTPEEDRTESVPKEW